MKTSQFLDSLKFQGIFNIQRSHTVINYSQKAVISLYIGSICFQIFLNNQFTVSNNAKKSNAFTADISPEHSFELKQF